MNNLLKRLLTAGLITTMLTIPAVVFADIAVTAHEAPAYAATCYSTADAAETEVIITGQMPVTSINGAWALVNLLATIATVIIAAITVIFSRKKKDEKEKTRDQEKHERKTNHNTFLKGLGVITAIVSVIAFILTEHMSHLMQLTDNWTMVMILLLALEALLGLISKEATSEMDVSHECVMHSSAE